MFLLSPANVQVTAEDKAKIAEGGFFNLSLAPEQEIERVRQAVLSIVFQVLYLLLYFFLLTLLARFVLGAVLQYGRRWQPGRGAAAGLEVGVERH